MGWSIDNSQVAIDAAELANAERLLTETERLATEAERLDTQAVKVATEVERIAIRQQQEAFEVDLDGRVTTVETKSTSAETIAKEAKARADLIIGQAGTSNTEIVDSRLGADLVARATSGTLIREIHSNQLETARQTTTLTNGVSVVSGGVDALAETEIEGRTLISLANSNLEATKQYVVADKKTKVIVDNVTQSGVAKFTKGTTTVSTANYLNKVAGSTVANPHISKRVGNQSTLQTPTGTWAELLDGAVATGYGSMATLNGSSVVQTTTGVGLTSQILFSFDIIAEIERKLGIIPKSTVADKIKWIQDNVDSLTANWYGLGSSVGGNKATLARWSVTALDWSGYDKANIFHTAGTVTNLSALWLASDIALGGAVDANGFAHYLAYANASDGTTASSISTDYIDLVVTLKATAQLNTRPTIIRVENFEGKVNGSVVENPHVVKSNTLNGTITSMQPPNSSILYEINGGGASYPGISTLNGISTTSVTNVNGSIAQQLFSFNLIEAVERNVGKIPRTSVADKVQWIKGNVTNLRMYWYGFGSGPLGNKANLSIWVGVWGGWGSTNTQGVVTKTGGVAPFLGSYIQADGFVHYLAYADASDGVTASTINTDYIDLEIELKPTADFTRPKVALYEVTAENYAKILVDWSADEVVNRYPSVEGIQHLQGVGVIAEGENLLPPFTEWMLHPNAKVISPYNIELDATANSQLTYVSVPAKVGQAYILSTKTPQDIPTKQQVFFRFLDSLGGQITTSGYVYLGTSFSMVAPVGTTSLRVEVRNGSVLGKMNFFDIMLNLGTTAKPFVPRNPSYLYADVKLGAIGTVADRLYEQDGAKFVRKVVEKDFALGGSLAWINQGDYNGFKAVMFPNPVGSIVSSVSHIMQNERGSFLVSKVGFDYAGTTYIGGSNTVVTVSDTDTGFGETFVPSDAEIKAYFYGYKMNNGVFGTNYNGTGTKTWIPIGDTTNARAVTVVPTSASPTQLDGTIQPYKLSYVLATPQIVNVTDKVEGSLKVNGLTQIEALSGIVRREKVVPKLDSGSYYIMGAQSVTYWGTSRVKNSVSKILTVYKNGIVDKLWVPVLGGVGNYLAVRVPQADFDPTAEYTVTYIALDKPLLTANPTNIKLLYANNMRGALEDAVGKVQDNTTQLSVHEKAIVDLYVRVKALGG